MRGVEGGKDGTDTATKPTAAPGESSRGRRSEREREGKQGRWTAAAAGLGQPPRGACSRLSFASFVRLTRAQRRQYSHRPYFNTRTVPGGCGDMSQPPFRPRARQLSSRSFSSSSGASDQHSGTVHTHIHIHDSSLFRAAPCAEGTPPNASSRLLRVDLRVSGVQSQPPGPPRSRWNLSTHLDGLVSPTHYQARPGLVKRRAEDPRLGVERARLRQVLARLERQARLVVPPGHRAVVACCSIRETWRRAGQRTSRCSETRGCDAPPEKKTPSWLTDTLLMMASCPLKLCTNVPLGTPTF